MPTVIKYGVRGAPNPSPETGIRSDTHLQSPPMHDAPSRPQLPALRPPDQPTLPAVEPDVRDLFKFMAEAELRFTTLRMRIVDQRTTTHGEETETHELWLRHTGNAK